MAGREIRHCRLELPQLHLVHRRHRGYRAGSGNGSGEVHAFSLLITGYLPSAYRRKLCHPRWCVVYAAERLCQCRRKRSLCTG